MVKLKRLKIHRYRNVEPCELIFGDRRNVLLGPNGAGKTTLLSFISKILRTNLNDPDDPFSIEIELTLPQGSLTAKISSREPEVEPVELLNLPSMARAAHESAYATPETPDFECTLSLSNRRSTTSLRHSKDHFAIHGTNIDHKSAENFITKGPPGLLTKLVTIGTITLERNTPHEIAPDLRNAYRFDESLDMFHALTTREDSINPPKNDLQPRFHFHRFKNTTQFALRSPGSPGQGITTNEILNAIKLGIPDESTEHSISEKQLTFLSESVRLLGLRSAVAKLELINKDTTTKFVEHFEFGNLKFWFTRRDGSIFQDQHLSYGQKRLLTFLYYLDANPSFVIADELVNGLHHAWIEECMNAIGDRQAFLTSQNPLLLDYLSFESVEQVKESFILCRNQADGDRERMTWRNMTDDEADMFYRAYQVGIEHVGEILRTRGLW
ncbi:AAA family ATPase [Sorangium sp. So ce1036]|uniref:AAA family ATPase n=1 Tax=Sorangium sp. So ce1036 TaxID=3133328 RepID=UPI003F089474